MCTLCSVQIVNFVQIVARPECKKLGAARGVAENQVIQVVGQIFRLVRMGNFIFCVFSPWMDYDDDDDDDDG